MQAFKHNCREFLGVNSTFILETILIYHTDLYVRWWKKVGHVRKPEMSSTIWLARELATPALQVAHQKFHIEVQELKEENCWATDDVRGALWS